MGGTTPQATTTLTEADNGSSVEVHVGETVVLRLHENAATGYRWTFEDLDTSVVSVRGDKYLQRTEAVGSGGDTLWTLGATAPGKTQVKLKLWRRWEGDSSIQKRFAVTLVIRS